VSAADLPTRLGEGVTLGAYSIVTAGAAMGAHAYLGDHASLRENARVEAGAVVGFGGAVGHSTRLGARSRLQTHVLVGPWTTIEEDVFVGGHVTFMSDGTMGRRDAKAAPVGIVIRRGARIGSGALVLSPAEVGEEAVVGAASLVRQDVPPRTVVAGTPARHLRAVRDDELLESWPFPLGESLRE
jgi:acetyltransferase-like isoleucine patch superfamily enzyme